MLNHRPLGLNALITVFLGLWLLAALFPFAWTVWGSFKVEPDFFSRESWWFAIDGTRTRLVCDPKRQTERAQAAIRGLVDRGILCHEGGFLWCE